MKLINKFKSPSFNKRIKNIHPTLIIIHYTAMFNEREAIDHLINPINKVSSHFFINKKGSIYNMVDIKKRAWHAGLSYWNGLTDINSNSIGVELDNSGPLNKNENFTTNQINQLIKLLKYLQNKYSIVSNNILGHSDISPYRKVDPGLKFPWKLLYKKKIGFFPKKINQKQSLELDKYFSSIFINNKKEKILYMLSQIGYDINMANKSTYKFKLLIKSYQIHYNQSQADGLLDSKTLLIIRGHFNEILTKGIKYSNKKN